VQIKKGLALNASGEVLRLLCDQTVSLVRPPNPAQKAGCVFSDCAPFEAGSTLSRDGYYLLTIAPASQREGLAPVSGLGNSPAACNSRYFSEGVQFRLLPLSLTSIEDAKRVRNEVAYQCFGIAARGASEFVADALQGAEGAPYGWETLVRSRSTEHDVALAIMQWNADEGLVFLDRWAVRRRVIRSAAAKSWGYFADYRRRGEAEAMLQQFQEELTDIRGQAGVARNLAAEQRFKYLPPAGLLPVGGTDFDWKIFLGAHAPKAEIALDVEQTRALLWRSLSEEPVTVVAAAKASASPAPVRFHVYRLSGQTGLVLFIRSAMAEVVADDVYYDNSACRLEGVQTVQAALDALCSAKDGCCTLVASPGQGWEKIFDRVQEGGDANVCFPVGHYPLSGPITIKRKGHLRLTGCGFGSLIAADRSEAALVFERCTSVNVRDLAARSGVAGSKGSALENLNGTFTFLDCGSVVIEGASFRCAPDGQTSGTCVTVRNGPPNRESTSVAEARLRRCELAVGSGQIGVLLINVTRTMVEDNVLRAEGKPTFHQVIAKGRSFQGVRRRMVSRVVAGPVEAAVDSGGQTARITYNQQTIQFLTHPGLIGGSPAGNAWQKAIDVLQPMGINNPQKLREFVEDLADKILLGGGLVAGLSASTFPGVVKEISSQIESVGSCGIRIAGTVAPEVRVLNNSLEGFLAGIHLGLSHRDKTREEVDHAGMVTISGNRVQIRLSDFTKTERHGIFVGNVTTLSVENNFVTCERASNAEGISIEGIRIYGFLGGVTLNMGGRIILRGNHLKGFGNVGILFNPLNDVAEGRDPSKPWIVSENLADGAKIPVQVRPGFESAVRRTDNYS
jgi:hypothetical protein